MEISEEEKKAIELLEDIKNNSWTTKYIMSSDSKNAELLLNLIAKLQKENEELKNQEATARKINELLVQRYSNSIPVQKIKDKIEELNKEIKSCTEIDAIFKIKQQQILQELLGDK